MYISKCLLFHFKESTPKVSSGGHRVKFSRGGKECALEVKRTQNLGLGIPGLNKALVLRLANYMYLSK